MLARRVGLAALGGAGLAGDGNGVAGDLAADGAGHQCHALPHQIKGVAVALDDIHHLRLGLAEHLAGVGIQNGLDKVGAVAHTVVGQRGGVGSQLDGAYHRVALPDCGLNIQRGGVVFIRLFGQASYSLVDLHAGALPKTQLVGVGIVDVTGQAAAHIVEEDVAAPLDSGDHINVAAVAVAGAAGVVILIIGVHAGAVDGGVLVDQAAVQRRHRHSRFKGGAGSVQALQRPVEQGQTGVSAVLGIVGSIQVLVKAGVVRSRQHAAVLHIQHHRSTGGGFHIAGVVYPVDHIDVIGKGLVHRPLKVAVDGQLHGMPRLRHGGDLGVHDHAVRIAGDSLHTVLAAQLVLVHRLKAGDADHIVHVVAFFLERIGHLTVFVGHLPLFGGDLAHTPQHSGEDISLLIAAGAGLHDLHARQSEGMFLDGSNRHLTDVFCHDEVVHVGKGLPVHLIMDARQHPLPRQRKAFQMVLLH